MFNNPNNPETIQWLESASGESWQRQTFSPAVIHSRGLFGEIKEARCTSGGILWHYHCLQMSNAQECLWSTTIAIDPDLPKDLPSPA